MSLMIWRPRPGYGPLEGVETSAMKAPITPTASAIRAPLSAAGKRCRQLGQPKGLPACRIERAQQLELVAVDVCQRIDGRHEHGEEADQGDHHELGQDPEAPPEHEQHADHRNRHRLRAHRERVDGASQQWEEVKRDAHREAQSQRQSEAEQDLLVR